MTRYPLAAVLLVVLPGLAWCGKVKVWNHSQPAHFEKAELKGVVLSSDGSIRLARQLRPLPGIDAAHVWALVEDRQGNLFVATGNEGKIYRLTPKGEVAVVYHGEESQVLALALGSDDAVYAGTGPNGYVVRIPAAGEGKVFCKTGEGYVWSLAFDAQGETLFAGTGPHGRVLQIDQTGRSRAFYTTKQDHILCLAVDGTGNVFAGTSKRGLVCRIDPQGKGFVLFDAPQSEVRSLSVGKDGVYAGTAAPSSRRTPATAAAAAGASGGNVSQAVFSDDRSTASTPGANDRVKSSSPAPAVAGSSGSSGSSSPPATPPSSKENSVYRIQPDGTVREVFREKTMILGLLPRGDGLLIATGGDGQLFECRPGDRERTELLRLDHTQIHCLCQRRDGSLVLGAGDPGKLYVLEDKLVDQGHVTSEVLDAKSQSRWGQVRLKGQWAFAAGISLQTRSGNVAEPDDTWSEWAQAPMNLRRIEDMDILSPNARFLQYRVNLSRIPGLAQPLVTPVLQSIALRYQPVNQSPEVTSIDVPDLDVVTLESPKKLRIRWSASDPNEDDLTYRLEYRKEGWQDWVLLESDFEKREYEWDATTTPAGVYQFRVQASDRKDNPETETLVHTKISLPFIVDHVAPRVELKLASFTEGRVVIKAYGSDDHSRLVSASFSVDSKKWTNVFPENGLFDGKTKTFQFKTDKLAPGSHVLVLRITDASGNTGTMDVVFQAPGDD